MTVEEHAETFAQFLAEEREPGRTREVRAGAPEFGVWTEEQLAYLQQLLTARGRREGYSVTVERRAGRHSLYLSLIVTYDQSSPTTPK